MNKPICSHSRTRVIDSRETKGGTRRRRQCMNCLYKYTTLEIKIDDNIASGYILEKLKKTMGKEESIRIIEKVINTLKEYCQ